MNYRTRYILDWRVQSQFGFAQYGDRRVLLIGKLCIHLWKV